MSSKPRTFVKAFQKRMHKLVPEGLVKWGTPPVNGELYWREGWKRLLNRNETCLKRKKSHGQNDYLVSAVVGAKGIIYFRVAAKLFKFKRACTNNQLKLLKPRACVDPTQYGVEIKNCDIEKACQVAEVCAKLLDAGELGEN